MKQVVLVLASILGMVSIAAGGNIDGTIGGWSASSLSSQRPAVVWLEGVEMPARSKIDPVMAQRGGQFVPSFLVVVAGQTVDMPNDDEVAHNVYSVSDAKRFNLGYYAKGDLKSVNFDQPGLVDVLCLIHHFMRAKILVVPNPYYSMVAANGNFNIPRVSAGQYTLNFWCEGMASFRQEIMVPPGGKPILIKFPSPSPQQSGPQQ
jgi:plastocyanin